VQALGGMGVRLDRVTQRHQRRRRRADPVGQRGDIEIDALAREDLALAVERQVRAVFAEQHLGEKLRAGASARDRMRRGRRLRDLLAVAARPLLAHVLDHLPLRWDTFQRLRHVLAELAQAAAAARTRRRRRQHDALARQMLGQRTTGRQAPLGSRARLRGLRRRDLGRGRLLGPPRHQLPELQLQLVHQHRGALGGGAEPVVLQLGDGELEMLDLCVEIVRALVLGDQHRLQRGDIVGKRGGVEHHAREDSCFAPRFSRRCEDCPRLSSATSRGRHTPPAWRPQRARHPAT
jgi:hypothetical protein